MARPTKLTAAVTRRVTALLRKGVPRERAARLAGIAPSTFHLWMSKGASGELEFLEFLEQVCKAENDLVAQASSVVVSVLRSKKASDRLNAAKFILSHRFPGDWSTRQEVRNTGPDGGPIQVQASIKVEPLFTDQQIRDLTPDQIRAALAGLRGES